MDVDTAITVPVNLLPLVALTDGYTIDEGIAYNESGMDLNWNFVTTAGVITQTNVVPTTSGDYDWTHVGNGMYKIELIDTGGASANNDTEGFGWFSGKADAILPFSGPMIGFRAAALNNALVDGGDLLDVSVTQLGGVAQSATDLKDFADTGYDPSTHKAQSDLIYIHGSALTETAGQLAAAFVKLFDVGAPVLVASDVMRGTDGANTTVPDAAGTAPTAVEIQAEMEEGGASLLDTIRDAVTSGSYGLSALKDLIDALNNLSSADVTAAVPTTAAIKTAMEAEGTSDLDAIADAVASGSYGLSALKDLIDALNDLSAADVATELGTYDGPTKGEMDTGHGLLATEAKQDTMDTVVDAIKTITDALTAAAATKLALSAGTIVAGTVSWDNTNASTTVFYSDDITEATADHYNGRIVIFTSGALQYQATDITDYALDTGEGKFTVTALTEAPADNVTFIII